MFHSDAQDIIDSSSPTAHAKAREIMLSHTFGGDGRTIKADWMVLEFEIREALAEAERNNYSRGFADGLASHQKRTLGG